MSLTGIMDNRLMSGQQGMDTLEAALGQIKDVAVKVWEGWWCVCCCAKQVTCSVECCGVAVLTAHNWLCS